MSIAVLDRLRADRDEARNAAIALAEQDNFDPADEAFTGLAAASRDPRHPHQHPDRRA